MAFNAYLFVNLFAISVRKGWRKSGLLFYFLIAKVSCHLIQNDII